MLMQRYLFMKIMYHDHAPESYDPPYFKSLEGDKGVGHFNKKPFSMWVQSTKQHPYLNHVGSVYTICFFSFFCVFFVSFAHNIVL